MLRSTSLRSVRSVMPAHVFEEMAAQADVYAPEHLHAQCAALDWWRDRLSAYGSLFLGAETTVAFGDKAAGPNHVLPTARTARFSSGLGVLDFMKRTTTVAADAQGLGAVGPAAIRLAEMEGLDAHARSIAVRLNRR